MTSNINGSDEDKQDTYELIERFTERQDAIDSKELVANDSFLSKEHEIVKLTHEAKEMPANQTQEDPTLAIEDMDTVSISSTNMLMKETERGHWSKHIEFFLAVVSAAVGLGNIWRFPFKCYENGGSAFLFPYLISLFVTGIPLFYMELALGQYISLGPLSLFKRLMPALEGQGIAMFVLILYCAIFYNMIVAWVIFYFFGSLISLFKTGELEWTNCKRENLWNTINCYQSLQQEACNQLGKAHNVTLYFFNFTCYLNETEDASNSTIGSTLFPVAIIDKANRSSSSFEYYDRYMLTRSSTVEDTSLSFPLIACLTFAWIVVFFCIRNGVQTVGKVAYFTGAFPYVVLTILVIYGATLEGAAEGIKFYLIPEFRKLWTFSVWKDAISQLFYSLGVGCGTMLTLASYNPYKNNCYRDALSIAMINSATSIFAGFAVFSFIGFMAKSMEKPVHEVVKAGPGLAFVLYPEAFSQIGQVVGKRFAAFLAALFFLMLTTLGIGSQIPFVESSITAILDRWPKLRQQKTTKTLVIAGICIIMNLIGLIFCMRSGVYYITLVDNYPVTWGLIFSALTESLIIGFLYRQSADTWCCGKVSPLQGIKNWFSNNGAAKFSKDVESMIGKRPSYYWRIMWTCVTPLTIIIVLLATVANHQPAQHDGYIFPSWMRALGWCLSLTSISCVPICALFRIAKVYYLYRTGRVTNLQKYMKKLFRTSNLWLPAHERAAYKLKIKDNTRTLSISSPARASIENDQVAENQTHLQKNENDATCDLSTGRVMDKQNLESETVSNIDNMDSALLKSEQINNKE